MIELIHQVQRAMAACEIPMATEKDVVTFITRPMWRAFLAFHNLPEDTEPTEWQGKDTVRVFGSETRIVESELWWAVSVPAERLKGGEGE